MIRYFFRHIWESIKNLKRNFWMTFASVSMVAVTLTLVGVFAATLLNIQRVASGVENNVHINTYLQVDSTDVAKVIQNTAGEPVNNDNYHSVYDKIAQIKGVKRLHFLARMNN